MRLHHFAYSIRPGTLEVAIGLFENLGCSLSFRKKDARWCLIKQRPIPIDIQIIESDRPHIRTEEKINTHICFLSDTLAADMDRIRRWAEGKNLEFREGCWSDDERWFDLPDVFIDFVIEMMHSSVIE